MKKLILTATALLILASSGTAFAEQLLPCVGTGANATPSGTACHIDGEPHYSCGGGEFVKKTYGSGACNGSSVVNDQGDPLAADTALPDRSVYTPGPTPG